MHASQIAEQCLPEGSMEGLPLLVKSPSELFEEACTHEVGGRLKEAEAEYRELLALEPSHLLALNQLGHLLLAQHRIHQAHVFFERAVRFYPSDRMSLVNLGNVLMRMEEYQRADDCFDAALKLDPGYRPAHAGLSFSQAELGNPEKAKVHRRIAFRDRCILPAPYRGTNPPIIVLDLSSTLGANFRSHEFLSERVFKRYMVAAEFFDESIALPEHHMIVNSIGDADVADEALVRAEAVFRKSSAPYVNHPSAVRATRRSDIAERLAHVANVVTAKTIMVPREALEAEAIEATLAQHGFAFPILLRSPGFHGGEYFEKVDSAAALPDALKVLPGEELLLMEYLDARGRDGKSRKYRVMMVNGQLYPLHVAISSNWKIHYFSAEMAENATHRAEDNAYLQDMHGVLGEKVMTALQEIQRILGLDYGGIDFGLNERGEVLVFEANASMAVVVPEKDTKWDYRRQPVETIYKAVWMMLRERAEAGAWTAQSAAA